MSYDDEAGPCHAELTRWWHGQCYCDRGLFYDASWPPSGNSKAGCSISGPHVWGTWLFVLTFCESAVFLILLGCCAARAVQIHRAGAGRLERVVHLFSLLAVGVHLSYIVTQTVVILTPAESSHEFFNIFCQFVAPYLYSSFFPFEAAAFLCIYHYWLRFMSALDALDDISESPPYRSPLCMVPLLLSLELLRDTWVCLDLWPATTSVMNAIYFVWLTVVDLFIAVAGLVVVRRLRTRILNAWVLPGNSRLYKVRLCAAVISVTSVLFIPLSIFYAVVGRFYAWPWFVCRALVGSFEAVYIIVIFAVTSHIQHSVSDGSLELEGGSLCSESTDVGFRNIVSVR